jgi:hypothetical protein
MTPKEKAKELVDKFSRIDGYQDSIDLSKCEYEKQCALIAVEELLKDTEEIDGMRVINNPYWLEVRNEIEKL